MITSIYTCCVPMNQRRIPNSDYKKLAWHEHDTSMTRAGLQGVWLHDNKTRRLGTNINCTSSNVYAGESRHVHAARWLVKTYFEELMKKLPGYLFVSDMECIFIVIKMLMNISSGKYACFKVILFCAKTMLAKS